jgi:sulfur carrier protein ThiS
MTVTFKLFASLSRYLPPGAEDHQIRLDVPEGTSPLALLQSNGVPLGQVHLVLVNGVFVPPSVRDNPLSEGDELAVWPAVAGG